MDSPLNAADVMIDDLRRLVEIESPSSDPAACRTAGDELTAIVAERLGGQPESFEQGDRRHLLWRFGDGRDPSILLVGHIDTVFPHGALAERPFTVDGAGIARGPGVYDMKSGLVQAIHAAAMLDDPSGVALFVNDDEEVGSMSSKHLFPKLCAGLDAALVFEGASDGPDATLKIARRGVSMYELHVHGRSAHAGINPHDGANALMEAAHLALAIAELAADADGTTVTPTVVHAGTATNVVPDHAVIRVDARATRVEEQTRVDDAMRALAPTVAGTSIEVIGGPNRPPMTEESAAALFDIAQRCGEALGHPPVVGVPVGGGSDASFIAPLGVPVIDGLGGVGGGGHQPDEWCDTTRMPERTALVAAMIDHIRSGALVST